MTADTLPQTVLFPDLFTKPLVATFDLDPTDDTTHGDQQLTFFNGYYDSWCYLPMLACLTFDDEAEQYLCAAVLRPGNVPATRGARGLLCRLLALVRLAFPEARVRPERGERPDRTRLHRRAVCGRLVGPRAPDHCQSGSRPARRPRAAGQSAIRRDESATDAAVPVRADRLCPRRHRASDQRTARGPADRADELLSVLGEPTARLPHRRGLRADARAAVARGAYRVCAHPGDLAPRPVAETRRGYRARRPI